MLLPACLRPVCSARSTDAGPLGSTKQQPQQKKLSKVEELMQKDLEEKKRRAAAAAGASTSGRGSGAAAAAVDGSKGRLDHWLAEGIVVKVMSRALKEQGYYKQKVSSS